MTICNAITFNIYAFHIPLYHNYILYLYSHCQYTTVPFTGEKISLLWKFISIYLKLNGLTLNFHYLLLEGACDRYERECYKASLYHLIFASL